VESIGNVRAQVDDHVKASDWKAVEKSPLRCPDEKAVKRMKSRINKAAREGDTLGGVVRVVARGVPPGLGNHGQWDRKIEGRLLGALGALPAVKGAEVGLGFESAFRPGSKVHDPIYYSAKKPFGYYRRTNNAGGIEGGITNGEEVVLRAAMKPIPTLRNPLKTVNTRTKASGKAAIVRSDVCAVPALGVVAEAVVALEIAGALLEKFGGDSMSATKSAYGRYVRGLRR
jgi:chorismate synthase